uniref:RNA helicase n=1 Tax=Chromera velia CCMP2878 TaxID=1169474 RepID=A0A0G4HZ93_9ALVE|eukprot:Cvel_9638.t1-p1 / transcript=Cvel_9638.t1 / gene=Cvel_9638 / organism=Chromera_velia_CCMP2878 / gene_product=DEAD-box ATP-dependent RNA helicase 24, putative / transcript_product=DEAD-box ATP-dependent RNA helicase 24, putative / location=Cvel_scaffold560:45017-49159(-) / protein_length=946 / sequence_SO=supercontig / SO=protein_coding / is_pseudo=false
MADDDSYFFDDGDDQPKAPGTSLHSRMQDVMARVQSFSASTSTGQQQQATAAPEEDEEEDELEAFMAGINKEVKKQEEKVPQAVKAKTRDEGLDQAVDNEDSFAEFLRKKEERRMQTKGKQFVKASASAETETGTLSASARPLIKDDSGGATGYDDADSDDDGQGRKRSRNVEPLPPFDHGSFAYEPFEKNFYTEHSEITAATLDDIAIIRKDLRLSATGMAVPKPAVSFAHFGLPPEVMSSLRKKSYERPTPIQCQAVPAALSGRDLLCVAETGSGKTAAYLLPLLVHVSRNRKPEAGEGPSALVLCPTRELAVQIGNECKGLGGTSLSVSSTVLAGGFNKTDQFRDLKKGCQVVIANPGRLTDICQMKGMSPHGVLGRVSFVVLDEADRMLQLGFERQVQSILQTIRPDRQTLLFSATIPPSVERLARASIQSPAKTMVRVSVGTEGAVAVNLNVEQRVVVVDTDVNRNLWFLENLHKIVRKGPMLCFVNSQRLAMELQKKINEGDAMSPPGEAGEYQTEGVKRQKKALCIYGDMDQASRLEALTRFKRAAAEGSCPLIVCTDVASRGLDIPSIETVFNFEIAKDLDTHTHRIGRTARAGRTGVAYSIVTKAENRSAALLVQSLEDQAVEPSEALLSLAMTCGAFKTARLAGERFRIKKGKGKHQGPSSAGLGFSHEEQGGASSSSASGGGGSFVRSGGDGGLGLQAAGGKRDGEPETKKSRWDAPKPPQGGGAGVSGKPQGTGSDVEAGSVPQPVGGVASAGGGAGEGVHAPHSLGGFADEIGKKAGGGAQKHAGRVVNPGDELSSSSDEEEGGESYGHVGITMSEWQRKQQQQGVGGMGGAHGLPRAVDAATLQRVALAAQAVGARLGGAALGGTTGAPAGAPVPAPGLGGGPRRRTGWDDQPPASGGGTGEGNISGISNGLNGQSATDVNGAGGKKRSRWD